MEKTKILIVEDEAITAMETEGSLMSLGYKVTSIVNTGEKAIQKAEEDKPDIILMDIRIKGKMDGIEAADVIRSRFDIPVIFSTAYLDDERIERAKLTMPFGYILKPMQEGDLKVAIEMALYVAKVDVERKKAEESLMISETRFKELYNGMSSGVAVYEAKNEGEDFIIVDFNRAGEKIENFKKEEIIGRNVAEVFPGLKEFGLFDLFQRVWKTGEPEHHPTGLYKDERIVGWRENYVYKLPTGEIVAVYDDVTERKLAEAELEKSEKKYHDLYDNSPAMHFSEDIKTNNIVNCNQTMIDSLGYTKEEIIGRSVFDFYVPESAAYAKNSLFPKFLNNEKVGGEELQVQKKDGNVIDVSLNCRALYDSEGKIVQSRSSWRDISHKKQLERERDNAEQMVRLERDKFQSVLNAIGEGLYIVNDDYLIEYHNQILTKQYGECVGKKCHETIFYSEKPCAFCPLPEKIKKGELQNIEAFLPDGRNVNIVFSPYSDIKGDTKTIVLLFDVTEKKTLQAEALRAGHLAALGELSAGIAHEINNPISGIISLAELLQDQFSDLGQETNIPERIIKEGDRIAVIVSNLLSFARDRKEEHSPARLSDILNDAVNLIERQFIKDGIIIEIEIPSDLPKIKARSQEIQQVFLNLLSNARYALNQKYPESLDKKKITITAGTIQSEDGFLVQTVFKDTGSGIPKDKLDKIINPFFSTKPKGEGTGLGLSISHTIIKDHKGRIRFESKEGDYTKVIIDLPVHNGLTSGKRRCDL